MFAMDSMNKSKTQIKKKTTNKNNTTNNATQMPIKSLFSPLADQLKSTVKNKEMTPIPKNSEAQEELVPKPNNTGIPTPMKNRFESLSGFSFDDVRVHSDKPVQLQALANMQGKYAEKSNYVGETVQREIQRNEGYTQVMSIQQYLPLNVIDMLESIDRANNIFLQITRETNGFYTQRLDGGNLEMQIPDGIIEQILHYANDPNQASRNIGMLSHEITHVYDYLVSTPYTDGKNGRKMYIDMDNMLLSELNAWANEAIFAMEASFINSTKEPYDFFSEIHDDTKELCLGFRNFFKEDAENNYVKRRLHSYCVKFSEKYLKIKNISPIQAGVYISNFTKNYESFIRGLIEKVNVEFNILTTGGRF